MNSHAGGIKHCYSVYDKSVENIEQESFRISTVNAMLKSVNKKTFQMKANCPLANPLGRGFPSEQV